jgi:putative colanic acid biosynthesis UDP-glucose lipid carrier transferase
MTHDIVAHDRVNARSKALATIAAPRPRAMLANERVTRSLRDVHRRANFAFRFAPSPLGGAWKRALDLVFAGLALVAILPLLAPIALLLRLDSPGPILFRQRRTGFRGRAFYVLKLRTMREGADDVAQAQRSDARVTKLGRLLRRSSIDELPQLLNVLAGDMSLVGPRPHAVAHDDLFWTVDAEYARRFVARPGITGLAQVNGERGLSDTPEKVRRRVAYDLAYVDRWSMRGDLGIIIATVRLLLRDKNAY